MNSVTSQGIGKGRTLSADPVASRLKTGSGTGNVTSTRRMSPTTWSKDRALFSARPPTANSCWPSSHTQPSAPSHKACHHHAPVRRRGAVHLRKTPWPPTITTALWAGSIPWRRQLLCHHHHDPHRTVQSDRSAQASPV